MNKKRITILTWRDKHHPEAGGAEEYIVNIAERLAAEGYEINFLTSNYPNANQHDEKHGINYYRYGGQYTQYLILPIVFLFKFRKQTDVLIENFNAWPYMIPLLKKKTITVIHHLQSSEWTNRFGKIIGSLFLGVSRALLSLYKNTTIVTVSPSTRQELIEKNFNPKKISIIYNGINYRFFEQSPLQNHSTNPINILFMGRQVRTKRTLLGLQLLEKYHHKHPDTKFQVDIIGVGEALPELKEYSKNLPFPVICHGHVSEAEKIEITTAAHLHMQLAEKEGWGITTIEAASKGVPTLCLNVPGLRDSVTMETGYIANSESALPKTLEEALADILANDEHYQTKRMLCYERSKQFTWQHAAEQFAVLIQNFS